MRSTIVAHEPGRFCGWPANNGLWRWDNSEVLVGFATGRCVEQPGHNIVRPYRAALARSTDGGLTWRVEDAKGYVDEAGSPAKLASAVDLTQTGFALRVSGAGYHGGGACIGTFRISRDGGQRWQGPYLLEGLQAEPSLSGLELTARTEYAALSSDTCLLFMSARQAEHSDRAFVAITEDGGRSFRFLSWIVSFSDPFRAVMPSAALCSANTLVAAVRRRAVPTDECWIDSYVSDDLARTWSWAGRVGDTGPWNGNPPALIRLSDNRLCCVFGDRARRRMVAKFSADMGCTWGAETVIRSDFQADRFDDPDLGYPQVFQRPDGQVVAVYYWATSEMPDQHIAATRWDPNGDGGGVARRC